MAKLIIALLFTGSIGFAQSPSLRPLSNDDGEHVSNLLSQQFDEAPAKGHAPHGVPAPSAGGTAAEEVKIPNIPNITPVPISPVVTPVQTPQQETPLPDPRKIITKETLKTAGIGAGIGVIPGVAAGVSTGFLLANAAGIPVGAAAALGVGVGLGVVGLFALAGAILGYLIGAGEVLKGLFP